MASCSADKSQPLSRRQKKNQKEKEKRTQKNEYQGSQKKPINPKDESKVSRDEQDQKPSTVDGLNRNDDSPSKQDVSGDCAKTNATTAAGMEMSGNLSKKKKKKNRQKNKAEQDNPQVENNLSSDNIQNQNGNSSLDGLNISDDSTSKQAVSGDSVDTNATTAAGMESSDNVSTSKKNKRNRKKNKSKQGNSQVESNLSREDIAANQNGTAADFDSGKMEEISKIDKNETHETLKPGKDKLVSGTGMGKKPPSKTDSGTTAAGEGKQIRDRQESKENRATETNGNPGFGKNVDLRKISSTLFWLIGKNGWQSTTLQPKHGAFLIRDILRLGQFRSFSPADICAAVGQDDRSSFLLVDNGEGIKLNLERQNSKPQSSGLRRYKNERDRSVQLSKNLSYILRHGAAELRLRLSSDGYLPVDELLELPQMRGFTVDDVKQVVDTNDKQRFNLKEDKGRLLVRANQGHSLKVDNLDLAEIKDAREIPGAVHGTYYEYWESIQYSGLNCGTRNHIHFAKGEPDQKDVISGMRSDTEVVIYVDIAKALKDGIKFYRSANDVILSHGIGGVLPPQYFSIVHDRHTREILYCNEEMQQTMREDARR